MLLYLVQHAEAKKEEEDPSRGLTDRGLNDIKRVSAHAAKLGIKVSQIFHSDKKRAVQTAQVLSGHLKPGDGVAQRDGLAPLDDPEVWAGRLKGLKGDTVLVGHLPHLARLSSLLLCGDINMNIISFEMAGIVCLQGEGGSPWSIKWMLIPGIVA